MERQQLIDALTKSPLSEDPKVEVTSIFFQECTSLNESLHQISYLVCIALVDGASVPKPSHPVQVGFARKCCV